MAKTETVQGVVDIDPQTAHQQLEACSAVFVDIREPEETCQRYISGAIFLPLSKICPESSLDVDVDKKVVFYCRSGNRTTIHADLLHRLHHGPTEMMAGGINRWAQEGFDVAFDGEQQS